MNKELIRKEMDHFPFTFPKDNVKEVGQVGILSRGSFPLLPHTPPTAAAGGKTHGQLSLSKHLEKDQ